jgi:hypothetical protein
MLLAGRQSVGRCVVLTLKPHTHACSCSHSRLLLLPLTLAPARTHARSCSHSRSFPHSFPHSSHAHTHAHAHAHTYPHTQTDISARTHSQVTETGCRLARWHRRFQIDVCIGSDYSAPNNNCHTFRSRLQPSAVLVVYGIYIKRRSYPD